MRQQLQGGHTTKVAAVQDAINRQSPAGTGKGGPPAGPHDAAEASVGSGSGITELAKSDAKKFGETEAYQTQPEQQQHQQEQQQSQSKAAEDTPPPEIAGLFRQVRYAAPWNTAALPAAMFHSAAVVNLQGLLARGDAVAARTGCAAEGCWSAGGGVRDPF